LVVLLLLLCVALFIAWYVFRWLRIRRGGGVSVALRWRPDSPRASWHLGIGRYEGQYFTWYRVWSLRSRPDRMFEREDLEIADRREPEGSEAYAVPAGATVLRCEAHGQQAIEIAMGPGALTGFLSWLESAPPGRSLPHVS
jgi:hypothetical protein